MKSARFRKISLALFLASMPLTVLDSSGPGFFADSDGWQGYEVAILWPLLFGTWDFIPIGFATAYILCGMWLTNAPRLLHIVGTGSCWLVFVLLPIFWVKDLQLAFILLEAAWAFAACSRLVQRPEQAVNHPSPTPDAPFESN